MATLLWKKSLPLPRFQCFAPIIPSIQLKVYKDSPCSMCTYDEVKAMFEKWAIEYGTPEEKQKRYEIFKGTVRFIDLHNTTGDPSWGSGLNGYSDRALEECCGRIRGCGFEKPVPQTPRRKAK